MKPIHLYYNYLKHCTLFLSLIFILSSCEKFEYSPYEIRLPDYMQDLNAKNIFRIKEAAISPSDTLIFAITSDTQGFYAHNDDLVEHINKHQDADFVLHNGDITDFGLLKEHKWIYDDFSKLEAPYVTVIGNHDATGNGKDLYKAMYGDYNFTFVVADRKFIFLNTNHWEFDGKAPDLGWLERELQDAEQYQNVFVVSHIPPNDAAFGKNKIQPYKDLLREYGVSLSIHGHGHGYAYTRDNDEDVYELQVASTDKREYILMKVFGSNIDFKRVNF